MRSGPLAIVQVISRNSPRLSLGLLVPEAFLFRESMSAVRVLSSLPSLLLATGQSFADWLKRMLRAYTPMPENAVASDHDSWLHVGCSPSLVFHWMLSNASNKDNPTRIPINPTAIRIMEMISSIFLMVAILL